MNISRRGFLKCASSGLLLSVAPAIVRAESLMKIQVAKPISDWEYVMCCVRVGAPVPSGHYRIHRPIEIKPGEKLILRESRITATKEMPHFVYATGGDLVEITSCVFSQPSVNALWEISNL